MSGSTTAAELKEQIEAEREGVPFLVLRDGEGVQQIVTPSGPQATLGRSEAADVLLVWDSEVSHVHAELLRVGDAWTVTDDGLSRNGTFVNGSRIGGRARLRDGDVIRVGATILAYRRPASADLSSPTNVGAPRVTRDGAAVTFETPSSRRCAASGAVASSAPATKSSFWMRRMSS